MFVFRIVHKIRSTKNLSIYIVNYSYLDIMHNFASAELKSNYPQAISRITMRVNNTNALFNFFFATIKMTKYA